MADIPIKVNALAVEKSDDKFIVTVGSSNRATNQLELGMSMALLLVDKIGKAMIEEVPVE